MRRRASHKERTRRESLELEARANQLLSNGEHLLQCPQTRNEEVLSTPGLNELGWHLQTISLGLGIEPDHRTGFVSCLTDERVKAGSDSGSIGVLFGRERRGVYPCFLNKRKPIREAALITSEGQAPLV